MAWAQNVHTDNTWLSWCDRQLNRLEFALALGCGFVVLGLMGLAVVSVSGRQLFGSPLPGYVDWIEQAMPFIAFPAVSFVQRCGGHVRMDIFLTRLRGRTLWAVEWFGVVLILVVVVLLLWGSWAHFLRSFDPTMPLWSLDSTIDIALPMWPTKLIVPCAFFVMALRLVLQVWAYGRAFVRAQPSPVAIPLQETIAQQAHKEAGVGLDD